MLDGELVIAVGKHLSFDDLLMRIHPAASRVQKLAEETPATYIVFDLLEDASGVLAQKTLEVRRPRLDTFAKKEFARAERIELSPATRDVTIARKWFKSAGKALDGIIAKRADVEYRSDDRTGMQKIKKQRTVDCVVGGFRYGTNTKTVGSLLLGLYDEQGRLNHVGFTSGIARSEKAALTKKLERLVGRRGSRESTRRAEPVEYRAIHQMGAIETEIGGRGRVRSFYRRPISTRDQAIEVAAG